MGGVLPTARALAEYYEIFVSMAILVTAAVAMRVMTLIHHRPLSDYRRNPYPVAYQWLAWGIGGLWILDGFLQAQPLMVTRFVGGVVAPLIIGQPLPLAFLIELGSRLWTIHPVLGNAFATWLQITIGLLILLGGTGRWRRIGLWLSIGWGLVVWVFGEALGSIFVNGSWVAQGSPGSVLFYVLAAVLLLLSPTLWQSHVVSRMIRWGFVGLWTLSALLQAWPGSGWWTANSLSVYELSMAQMAQPSVIAAPLYWWSSAIHAHPLFWNGLLVVTFLFLAALWLFRPRLPLTWWVTATVVFLTWWLGQDFGVLGGMGTDPNSGIVALLGLLVYWQFCPEVIGRWVLSVRYWRRHLT
ncbi:MAG: hypothetical protein C7B45_15720 [Sulfobacillus acidophilus]|uniref:Uncharacterized protein n=1 Tax=Sulfobacillus acidophilus TaxID=53633 RepID=A0A2T2WDE8_9FIRM|nr:MAG: hypothetical protein C7B45_15720 [Sulfobacillus acidophilus]